MNKKTAVWLALALLVSCAAGAQQTNPESDFEARPVDGGRGVEITGYTGSTWAVRIPPRIQGLPVIAISGRAFFRHKSIISVTIPNSVISIGDYAFRECTSLSSVTIGNGVTTIGEMAFYYCTSLSSVTIPNSVTTIGKMAFGSIRLTSITIPASVTSIGVGAFGDVTTAILVAPGSQFFSAIDGVLYDRTQSVLIQYPLEKSGDFAIPNSVTTIGDSAFFYRRSLSSVTIPNSVTTIGKEAFYECTSLSSVTIPNSVTTIGDSAFYGTGITSVTIPASVITIGRSAFSGTCITSVTFDREGIILSTYPERNLFRGPFGGDLHAKYINGRAGTYTTDNPGNNAVWTKIR